MDDLIDEQTWKNAFLIDENKKYIEIPELKYEELDAIFRGIDSKIKNEITLGDIINFFNDYFKKSEKLIDINVSKRNYPIYSRITKTKKEIQFL